jgi:Holliday junction resolvase
MNRKSKGINAERDLVRMFWDKGWAAVRTPASGAARFPCPDVVASNKLRTLAIECKTSKKTSKYFQDADLEGLRGFSSAFGAEAWIGVKFNNQKWFFINPEDMQRTPQGFSITLNWAKMRGVSFEELLQEE